MNNEIRNLEPNNIWNRFADLNAVPRPSKHEERVIEFMMDFGKALGLTTTKDAVGNVIIKKPATSGMEDRKTVILQSHLDMVHQKNADTEFDFSTQGIEMYVDGDWVRAKGTTLGADNGLGVATIMALLESNEISHPPLEALFTIDEETGMTGAKGLKGGLLKGDVLLNLDTEDDDEIDIGCAGGIDITATGKYGEETLPEGSIGYKITVKGLSGGHSGMDIHKGLGNANKIMNALLMLGQQHVNLRVSEINGGGLRNAIPRESTALVVVNASESNKFNAMFQDWVQGLKKDFATIEPNLSIVATPSETSESLMEAQDQQALLKAIKNAHNGVYAMSEAMEDLVETSNNIARVVVKNGTVKIACLTRSSVEAGKMELANSLKGNFETAGYQVTLSGDYPGWDPNPDSDILKLLQSKYVELFKEQPNVVACHAGLECGILGQNYPDVDMISFGPTIKGAHSPDERASISSLQKFWKFTLKILEEIPKK
ncbi:aminoacyl-histidine dipeptidase [Arenibacter sp. BSSL-BM3]|uniref:Aminoacyl-histidine dipeptidase n=1 Tax=Arenibacter arenosicollis TaxID=2762274 RepID=A0ABR7QLK9_9FLAO|nr:aminoacyl-histidine dipeptidase [Arenibacter arenosicollis]MBC8768039.1 aminoacyl-histidine dipeptidase [Arenibacter arenosicollis]